MSQSPMPVESISYAAPAPKFGPRVWASAIIAICGLGLIGIGGCFTIGILIQLYPFSVFGSNSPTAPPPPWAALDYVLHVALYAMAILCFVSGGVLVWRATNTLSNIAGDRRVA